ncbi:alanine--tRNA ligase-related protein, partial [Campylobacter jejuni]|uniref:alanine--tRNA ligase-related protein n=1 Tax=Campylobacter jejuni TaxID=197 RepID=UPI001319B967
FNLLQKHIQNARIYKFGDKDNFWQVGDTGPCGLCSELFYDQGQEHCNSGEDYTGGDRDRILECWYLAFLQYDRSADGGLSPLQ